MVHKKVKDGDTLLTPTYGGRELAQGQNDPARAVAAIDELLALLGTLSFKHGGLEALYLKGKALHAQGRAREVLEQARMHATAIGSRRRLGQILGALSDPERAHGNTREAEKLRMQARGLVEYIAEHTSPQLLRIVFDWLFNKFSERSKVCLRLVSSDRHTFSLVASDIESSRRARGEKKRLVTPLRFALLHCGGARLFSRRDSAEPSPTTIHFSLARIPFNPFC